MQNLLRDTRYSHIFFVISVSLFFAAVFLGFLSIACRTSRRARLCEVRFAMVRIHSFRRYFAWGREREGGEESDNLFSRVSRRCCSYAASFFVYHVRIGGFLPSSPTVGSNRISQTKCGNRIHTDPEISKPDERCVFFSSDPREEYFFRSIYGIHFPDRLS